MTPAPVRVLLAIDTLGNGGAERQLSLLAAVLSTMCEVRVVSLGSGPFQQVIEAAGVDVSVVSRRHRGDVSVALKIDHIIRDWRPDIVHAWGWMSVLAAIPSCRLRGVPVLDGTIRTGQYPVSRGRFMRLGQRLADAVVANSAAGLDAFRVPRTRGWVIPNGVDPVMLARTEGSSSRPKTPGKVIMSARMAPEKDYATFIQAARLVRKTLPEVPWKFICVGDGLDRNAIRESATDLIDLGVVQFPEPTLDVIPLLAGASVGVLVNPGNAGEGCSNSILEYMASGLPVLCTDTGGNREVVVDGETGILLPPCDPTALAAAICAVTTDEDIARDYGRAGRARVEREYSVGCMVSAYFDLYSRVIGG